MPGGMTGFDVADRAMDLRPDVKVLLATGYAKGVEPRDNASAKANHKTLRKPYGIQELARALRELLD
jgi:two-component system CheB/CheR fusion protein